MCYKLEKSWNIDDLDKFILYAGILITGNSDHSYYASYTGRDQINILPRNLQDNNISKEFLGINLFLVVA